MSRVNPASPVSPFIRVIAYGALALFVAAWLSSTAEAIQQAARDQADAIQVGTRLYGQRCADCHGADAAGFTGPNLTGLWVSGQSDDQIFRTIRFGRPGSIMPPSTAPDAELRAIVAYLKSIGTVPADFTANGDVDHGEELFRSTCTQCHRVGQDGGRLGPDLSLIAQTRSRAELRRAIREPSASIAAAYRPLTLVTQDGEQIRGVRKGEDAFSVQIVDTNERLQGYRKADLEEVVREDESLMPVFGVNRLSDSELDDLLKFLGTLRLSDSG